MDRLLWLFPVGALAVTALLQDLKAFSLAVTTIGLLFALRQGRGAPVPARSNGSILPALLPHLAVFVAGFLYLGYLYPNASHDAIQAGNKGYVLAVWLGLQAVVALVLAGRWPVQRLAARLLLLGGLTCLLLTGIMGNGRWAGDLFRQGGTLLLFGLALGAEFWLGREEGEPDLAGLLPAFAAALGPAALFMEAERLWQKMVRPGALDLVREGRFLLLATGIGWVAWSGVMGLLGAHPRLRSLWGMAGYMVGVTVLYGVCWVLVG